MGDSDWNGGGTEQGSGDTDGCELVRMDGPGQGISPGVPGPEQAALPLRPLDRLRVSTARKYENTVNGKCRSGLFSEMDSPVNSIEGRFPHFLF